MPELPEVETMCRGIAPLLGLEIQDVVRPPCRFRPISIRPTLAKIQRSLRGKRVSSIRRLGKRVVLNIEDQALILQPKMSGLVTLGDAPDEEHVRLRIDFRKTPEAHLIFWDRRGLGTVEMLSEAAIFDRIISGRLGPDALEIDFDEFVKRLRKTRRPIKVALLDQKLLAGIGNLYASEILHVARIHPEQACDRISTAKLRRMYAAMQDILLDAIRHEGSTLSDGTYRNALNDPGNYQSRHLVYDRAERECPTCESGRIRRIVQAQRSTFFCPKCQRRPAANRRQTTT